MTEIIDNINLDCDLKKKVLALTEKENRKVLSFAKQCSKGNFSALRFCSDLMRLAVVIKCAENTKKRYNAIGISDEIFFDTMKDISIWCQNNDNKGLKNYQWIKNHLNCELFRLGRLQFQIYKCNNPTLNYDCMPFKSGESVIYIHIPQGEKLLFSDCVESLNKAISFFDKFFPDYSYRFFFCESWLLYEENWQFMNVSSNIMQFSSLFDVLYSVNNDSQAIERIFGKRKFNKKYYPENTSLQKSAKSFMLDGGKMGIGIGIIDKHAI